MKLRNRKTGEIIELFGISRKGDRTFVQFEDERGVFKCEYNSLSELYEEWEDYEEPKEYWYIEPNGVIARIDEWDCCTEVDREIMKQIGNYFETKEEAEQAVEKLKAWKRLKDKGFRFNCYMRRADWAELREVKALENLIDITAYLPKDKIKEAEADLDLLFGGEQ